MRSNYTFAKKNMLGWTWPLPRNGAAAILILHAKNEGIGRLLLKELNS